MYSVIREIFNGNICKDNMISYQPESSLYAKLEEKRASLQSKLSPEDHEEIEEFESLIMALCSHADLQFFSSGLKLGAHFVAEIFLGMPSTERTVK